MRDEAPLPRRVFIAGGLRYFRADRNLAARDFELQFIAVSQPSLPANGWRDDERHLILYLDRHWGYFGLWLFLYCRTIRRTECELMSELQ